MQVASCQCAGWTKILSGIVEAQSVAETLPRGFPEAAKKMCLVPEPRVLDHVPAPRCVATCPRGDPVMQTLQVSFHRSA